MCSCRAREGGGRAAQEELAALKPCNTVMPCASMQRKTLLFGRTDTVRLLQSGHFAHSAYPPSGIQSRASVALPVKPASTASIQQVPGPCIHNGLAAVPRPLSRLPIRSHPRNAVENALQHKVGRALPQHAPSLESQLGTRCSSVRARFWYVLHMHCEVIAMQCAPI